MDAARMVSGDYVVTGAEIDHDDTIVVPNKYLDNVSYLRHVGWTGCMPLEHNDLGSAKTDDEQRRLVSPIESPTTTTASTACDISTITAALANQQHPIESLS